MYSSVTIQLKAAEQDFHMVLFITLYKVLVTLGMKYLAVVCHTNDYYSV